MPHIVVKLLAGKSEQQKMELTEKIVKDVVETLHYGEESISLSMEEVELQAWTAKVYIPDIQAKWDRLYKKPGYEPF